MEWLTLFTLLVALASLAETDVVKKKIRIHLPEKVKHIHHYKKIYITNHATGSQYAPEYLPSADGAIAVPSKVAIPGIAEVRPLNSMEMYEHQQGTAPALSKLLPLPHTRNYYGANQPDWDDQNYDLIPPLEATNLITVLPSLPAPQSRPFYGHPPKRVKILTNEATSINLARKVKPKPIRNKLRQEHLLADEEFPVSSFHHQFYSDLEGRGTIKKIRKPHRVEKFVDGDTEHIHTYTEEHIHKMLETPAASDTSHTLIPIKNTQTLVAFASKPYESLATIGSLGTPSDLEYEAYNPRDVTYDHIFHDHGELPKDVDTTKETISLPPKSSYNSHSPYSTSGSGAGLKAKPRPRPRPTKPTPTDDFSYFENIFSTVNQKTLSPTFSALTDITGNEENINNYRPIPQFQFKEKPKNTKSLYSNFDSDRLFEFGQQQASSSVPSPFSVSNIVRHPTGKQYRPTPIDPPKRFVHYKDPFIGFKDKPIDDFDNDAYAASSNVYVNEVKNYSPSSRKPTQSNNFENKVQHSGEHVDGAMSLALRVSEDTPSALDVDSIEHNSQVPGATPTHYTIKEPMHKFYAFPQKAENGETSETERYIEDESEQSTVYPTSVDSTSEPPLLVVKQSQPSSPSVRGKPKADANLNKRRVKKNKINVIQPIYHNASDRSRYVYLQHYDDSENADKTLNYGDKI